MRVGMGAVHVLVKTGANAAHLTNYSHDLKGVDDFQRPACIGSKAAVCERVRWKALLGSTFSA